jgi:hypothetical protein
MVSVSCYICLSMAIDVANELLFQTRTADSNTYHRFSFLSENVLVFPNEPDWHIELCDIAVTNHTSDANFPQALTSTLVLQLPTFRYEMSFWNFYCHTEQRSHSSSLHNNSHSAISGSPFFTSPSTDGLIMFSVTANGARTMNTDNTGCDYLKFVVHRRALLELLDIYICRGGQLEVSDDNFTTQLSEDSDDSSSMQSFESDDNLAPPSEAEDDNLIDNSSMDSFEGVISVPWSKWGPSRTHWFDTKTASLEYTQLVSGQRIVIIPPKADRQ